jgi:ATP-independent RNA helicase DbpA
LKSTTFQSLPLSKALLLAISELGYSEMTPVQAASIPEILGGTDLIAQSKTGSGKTAAFVIPVLHKIILKKAQPQALILCPTRELSDQVLRECKKLAKHLPQFRSVSLVGGRPYPPQAEALKKGVHLVVGTPGRTLESLQNGKLNVSELRVLVLDEADRLLEEGFADEMKAILSALPASRQTVFFSATFPAGIQELSQLHQHKAKRVTIFESAQSKPKIEQFLYCAEKPEKLEVLLQILRLHPSKCTLIFCRTKAAVDEIGKQLAKLKITSRTLHADLPQSERDLTTSLFRKGHLQVVVATDVAARGLDIDSLELVINFDLPSSVDIYIHRIGRTGRAGRTGTAVSIATDYETSLVSEIETLTGAKFLRPSIKS